MFVDSIVGYVKMRIPCLQQILGRSKVFTLKKNPRMTFGLNKALAKTSKKSKEG